MLGGASSSQFNVEFKNPRQYGNVNYGSFRVTEIGSYSLVNDETFHLLEEPIFASLNEDIHVPMDLNIGYDSYQPRDSTKDEERHKRLLRWIVEKKYELDGVDVVSGRGILKDIGTLIYNFYRNRIIFRVAKYGGICYFADAARELEILNEEHRINCHYGLQFEKMITTPAREEAAEDGNKLVYSVVNVDMGSLKVLSRGEIDAVNPGTGNKVEIKSIKIPRRGQEARMKTNKFPGIWLQATLGKTEEVLIGMKTGGGIVTQQPKLYSLPQIEGESKADGGAMKGFIKSVLVWILPKIGEGQTGTVEFSGGRYCNTVDLNVENGHFLPDWYTTYVDNL